ncbi:MAG: 2-C-methyl-D-erythritol 4-phosphate cytidylyltransferase [Gammaproteobacteria bacterium]|nr:2-C-methyl-D-erythritol 4-phosphate cytidylyltransferase [Gammaproteobacteria bacterium]
MALHVVLPAAGNGQRMQSSTPKQYLRLGEISVIEHTVTAFLEFEPVERIVCATDPQDLQFDHCFFSSHRRVVRCDGGAKRSQSVLNGLEALRLDGAATDDWVMVHDVARPLITQQELATLWLTAQASAGQGAILVLPSVDSLRVSTDGESLSGIAERSRIYRAQTPQCFQLGALIAAIEAYSAATDESEAMIKSGYRPRLVTGRATNLKLTYPEDLMIAQAILWSRQ